MCNCNLFDAITIFCCMVTIFCPLLSGWFPKCSLGGAAMREVAPLSQIARWLMSVWSIWGVKCPVDQYLLASVSLRVGKKIVWWSSASSGLKGDQALSLASFFRIAHNSAIFVFMSSKFCQFRSDSSAPYLASGLQIGQRLKFFRFHFSPTF